MIKFLFFFFSVSVFASVFASVGQEVLIQGKVLNEFDETKVKIQDYEKQIYFLPRRLFPKDVIIKQGTQFSFEIDEKEIDNIKILKK